LIHQLVRFGISGGTVAAVYLGLGLLFSGPFGWPIQVAIPVAYLLAVCLNFSLQRWFVFRGSEFALSMREQAWRYVPTGLAQYGFTALCTAFLPDPLGVSEKVVYVCAVLVASLATFLFLRWRVFHGEG
jgi:putative flippase GtrA